jgi:glutamine amidotransferase
MGWNRVRIIRDHQLVRDLGERPRFYFVHAYHVAGLPDGVEVASATHGVEFPAIIAHENIAGVQFHPEKSHTFGMKLLTRFAELSGAIAA